MHDNKFWLYWWLIIVIGVVITAGIIAWYNCSITDRMLKAGYVYKNMERTKSYTGVWVLPEDIPEAEAHYETK
jgi:hypothetical protein